VSKPRLVAPTATAATAAVAAAPPATTTATTAATTILARTGFVHSQSSAVVLLQIQAFDGSLRFAVATHLDEAETLAATGVSIRDDFRALHGTELGEQLLEVRT
jgi:hypothetical protein